MEIKFIGRVGNMYISAVFKNVGKVSLSKDINDACKLEQCDFDIVKKDLRGTIVKVTTLFKEI